MRPIVFATAFTLGASACAGSTPVTQTPDVLAAERAAEARTVVEDREQLMRERELRAQLALARARTAELERQVAQGPHGDTVRIGEGVSANEAPLFADEQGSGWDEPEENLPRVAPEPVSEEGDSRPVLRLYGLPPIPGSGETLPSSAADTPVPYFAPGETSPVPMQRVGTTPPTPSVVPTNERLPWESAGPAVVAAPVRGVGVRAPQRLDLAVEAYRSALGLLRIRKFSESQVAFERFLEAHPTHPRASSARYWRAELMYIQRAYAPARVAFSSYLERYPSGARVPSALLKLALCNRRLGDEAAAQRHLATLNSRFPTSDAARLAARTGREGQR